MNKYIVVMIALIGFSGCKPEVKFIESEPGVQYRLVDERDGKKLGPNQAMLLDLNSVYKDSVVINPKPVGGFFINPVTGVPPMLGKILQPLGEGDSVQIKFDLAQYSMLTGMPITPDLDTAESVFMNIRVLEINDEQAFVERAQTEIERESAKQLEKDKAIIEEYLAENNLTAESTEEGLYFFIKKEGNGPKPQAGQTVSIDYVVQLLDGTYIDTSHKSVAEEHDFYNPQREPYEPYTFPLGQQAVIAGWDVGIPYLNKGASAIFFVPSGLAYGPESRPGSPIPPNGILMFEVELVDIKN
ncbi:FKBP-type peptidyl-prolyl cis-trans isomerase [Roseivirga seohaensis]|uniref:FKBP-type peptidyl-prolyl cis-trans isomerase n=1 Tax=Roseivirga seohaensis TaxID=1914963 RepID=UPI003BAA7EA5